MIICDGYIGKKPNAGIPASDHDPFMSCRNSRYYVKDGLCSEQWYGSMVSVREVSRLPHQPENQGCFCYTIPQQRMTPS